MAASFRAATTNELSYGMNLELNKPTGTVEDDLLIAFLFSDDSAWQSESGWTTLDDGAMAGGQDYAVLYKIAGASEPASYTFDLAMASNGGGILLAYSGADTTTPIDTHLEGLNQDLAPSVTTTANDETVLRGYLGDSAGNPATPAGTTSRANIDGTDCDIRVCDEVQATAGATGTADFAASSTDETAITIAIANAGGGGGGTSQPAAFAFFN